MELIDIKKKKIYNQTISACGKLHVLKKNNTEKNTPQTRKKGNRMN